MELKPALRQEYEDLFNTCVIPSGRISEVEKIIGKIIQNQATYVEVANATSVPWYFIGAIHNMEASLNFRTHLHNGDPLSARTFHVPAGRPIGGNPPFTWVESATDALTFEGLASETDWSLANTLFRMEGYNGWGYRSRHPEVLSPYLWSFSNHYNCGKYVSDGTWSPSAVSAQAGGAVLLRRMAELGEIEFPDQPIPAASTPVIPSYSLVSFADPAMAFAAVKLQEWLNTFPGVFVKVDGIPGARTSNAYKLITGNYLPGDPRG